jgi:hypothetical protein
MPEAGPDAPQEAGVDAGSVYAATVLADMPLAYWRLGEAPGSSTCRDATGNGNDAVVVGGVSLGVPGALLGDPNTAAHFDGTSATLLDIGNKFDFGGTVPLTLEVWANPDVMDGTWRHLEGKMLYDAGYPYDGIYMYVYGGYGLGYERWGNGFTDQSVHSSAVATGSWWHIVGTYASGTTTLYVNGVRVDGGPTTVSVTPNSASFQLGQLFQGSLDEVAVYGTALSAAQVLAHYHASGR